MATRSTQSQRMKEQQIARRLRAKSRSNARKRQLKARHEAQQRAPLTRSSARRTKPSASRKIRQLGAGRIFNTATAHIESKGPLIQAANDIRVAHRTENPQSEHAIIAAMLPQAPNTWTPSLDLPPGQTKTWPVVDDPERDWKVEVALKRRLCRDHDEEVLVGFCDTATDDLSRGYEFLRVLEKLRLVKQGELPVPNTRSSSWHADCTTLERKQVYAVQEMIAENGKKQFRIRWKLMWIPRRNLDCDDQWLRQQLERCESGFRRSGRLRSGHEERTGRMRVVNELLRSIG